MEIDQPPRALDHRGCGWGGGRVSDPFTTRRGSGPTVAAMSNPASQAQPYSVGLVVADMATTLDFYGRLGLDVPDEPGPHVELELGGLRLLLDTEDVIRSFLPSWNPPVGGGRVGLAFRLPDAAAVDAAHAELVGAGAHSELEPFDAPWGQRYATVVDPDGTGVDLFTPLS